MNDYAYLSLAQAAEYIRNKEISPVEYTEALIDRIDTHDARFNTFLRQTPELALEQAKQAEAAIQAGRWQGPMHGMPCGLKDIIDVEGIPTTGHSRILADNVAVTDATRVLRSSTATSTVRFGTWAKNASGDSSSMSGRRSPISGATLLISSRKAEALHTKMPLFQKYPSSM